MKTRAITGFFFLIVMIGSLLLGPQVFLGFYLVLTLLCLHEFYGLIIKSGITVNRSAGFVNAVAIFVLFGLINMADQPVYHKLLFLLTLTLASIFIQELLQNIAYAVHQHWLYFFRLDLYGNAFHVFPRVSLCAGFIQLPFPAGIFNNALE